jgi:hypothetical protein
MTNKDIAEYAQSSSSSRYVVLFRLGRAITVMHRAELPTRCVAFRGCDDCFFADTFLDPGKPPTVVGDLRL